VWTVNAVVQPDGGGTYHEEVPVCGVGPGKRGEEENTQDKSLEEVE
jgi:hypothetical protein